MKKWKKRRDMMNNSRQIVQIERSSVFSFEKVKRLRFDACQKKTSRETLNPWIYLTRVFRPFLLKVAVTYMNTKSARFYEALHIYEPRTVRDDDDDDDDSSDDGDGRKRKFAFRNFYNTRSAGP